MKTTVLLLVALSLPAHTLGNAQTPSARSTDPARLLEGSWRLVRITSPSGRADTAGAPLVAKFFRTGIIGGMAGPNAWSAPYTASRSGAMRIKSALTDLIGGQEAVQSGEYLNWMEGTRSFEVTSTDLRLKLADSRTLHFRRQLAGRPIDHPHDSSYRSWYRPRKSGPR